MWFPLKEKVSSLSNIDYFLVREMFASDKWIFQIVESDERKITGIQILDFHLKKKSLLTSDKFSADHNNYMMVEHNEFIVLFPYDRAEYKNDHFYIIDMLRKRFYVKEYTEGIISRRNFSDGKFVYFSVYLNGANTIYKMSIDDAVKFSEIYTFEEEFPILELIDFNKHFIATVDSDKVVVGDKSYATENLFKTTTKQKTLDWAYNGKSFIYKINPKKKEHSQIEVDSLFARSLVKYGEDKFAVLGDNHPTSLSNGKWLKIKDDVLYMYNNKFELISSIDVSLNSASMLRVYDDVLVVYSIDKEALMISSEEKKIDFSAMQAKTDSYDGWSIILLNDLKTFCWYNFDMNQLEFVQEDVIWIYDVNTEYINNKVFVSTRIYGSK